MCSTLVRVTGSFCHWTAAWLTVVLLAAIAGAQTAPFTVSLSKTSLTAYPGTSNDIQVKVASTTGFTGPVQITLTGLPGGVTATPSTLSLTPGTSRTITLSSALNADAAAFTGITNGSPNTSTRVVTFVGNAAGSSASVNLNFTTSLFNAGFNPSPGSTGLPVVEVTTTGGAPITSNETYVAGSVSITNTPTSYSGTMQIKGHGNSTWGMPKKPYKFKLDSKSGLLGMPPHKSWLLIANYDDKTLLRDTLASELSDRVGLVWAPHSAYVDLYLNGVYQGLYQLFEQVKVGPTRVAITSMAPTDVDGDAVTGGYLLQIDERLDQVFTFTTTQGIPIGLEDPDYSPDPNVPEQTTYIQNYVQAAENALYSSNYKDPATGWQAYFDADALVNFYLVNEIMGNRDGGRMYSSDYFWKQRGDPLLHMGPVWDFDISSGNENLSTIENPTVPWMNVRAKWYVRLFTDPAFQAKVIAKWNQVKATKLDTLPAFIDQTAAIAAQGTTNNFTRWPILGEKVWPNPHALGSHQAEVDYLKTWLNLRIAYLDSQFNGKAASNTTLNVDRANIHLGDSVSLTAKVTDTASAAVTSGTVSFLSGPMVIGSVSLDGTGTAHFVTTELPLGTDAVTAVFSGSSTLGLSASTATTVNVTQPLAATTIALSSSSGNAQQGAPVTLVASISAGSGAGAPTGTVTFRSGTTSLGSATLSSGMVAATLTNLPVGTDSVTAVYSGDANYAGSTSSALTIVVNPVANGCSAPSAPGVHICSPSSGGTYPSPVQITATGRGASGTVRRMEVWIDGVKTLQYSGDSVNSSFALASGSHRLVIVEVDSLGANVKSTAMYFTIGASSGCAAPTSPGINVCAPLPGKTYTSPVTVSAAAKPGTGSISRIELWLDGKKLGNFYASSINTSFTTVPGAHHITVVEVDTAGGILKSPWVSFTVQ